MSNTDSSPNTNPSASPPSHEEMCAAMRRVAAWLRDETDVLAGTREEVAALGNALRTALSQLEASQWREIDDHAKNGVDVILGRKVDTFVVLACWEPDDDGYPGSPWVAPEGCRYPVRAFDMYAPVPSLPAPPATASEGSEP